MSRHSRGALDRRSLPPTPTVATATSSAGDVTDRAVLSLANLRHRLWDPERRQEFVVSVKCLEIRAGSFVALLGPNASGKTTLLTLLGLLRRPNNSHGDLKFTLRLPNGNAIEDYNVVSEWDRPATIEQLRRRHLGFALQSGELLTALTVRENIALPLHLNGFPRGEVDD